MADAQPLIDRTISHYRIIEKLGGGGVGVVCNFDAHVVTIHWRFRSYFRNIHSVD